MIPAWTVSIAVFAALIAKYYGLDLPEVIRAKRTQKRTQITEKEWMLVLKYLGTPRTIEPFKTLPEKRSPGYIVFIAPALIFLLVSFLTSYLYALLFSFLSGVFFFICVRVLLGPKRTWKLTVRHHDPDRYLIPWSELKNVRSSENPNRR